MSRLRVLALAVLALVATGCQTALPDPESAGAQVYAVRCNACHRVFDPRSLTAAMWEVQVERMQHEMTRRGVNPLTEQERHLVLTYLRSHASDAPAASPRP